LSELGDAVLHHRVRFGRLRGDLACGQISGDLAFDIAGRKFRLVRID
jgi:hypothetical protein